MPPSASLPSPNWGQARCLGTRPHATVAPRGSHMASRSPNCQAPGRPCYPCDPHECCPCHLESGRQADGLLPSQYGTCSTAMKVELPGWCTNRAAGVEYKRPCPANGRPPADSTCPAWPSDRAALPMHSRGEGVSAAVIEHSTRNTSRPTHESGVGPGHPEGEATKLPPSIASPHPVIWSTQHPAALPVQRMSQIFVQAKAICSLSTLN